MAAPRTRGFRRRRSVVAAAPDTGDEVDRIMQVMERAFDPRYGEAWNRRQVSDALVLGQCHCALIAADGRADRGGASGAAGFYLSRTAADEEELLLFAVDPAHRRHGLGTRLLRSFMAAARRRGARRLFLEMRRDNPAGSLYLANGFVPVGVRPGYYRSAAGLIDAISFERIVG